MDMYFSNFNVYQWNLIYWENNAAVVLITYNVKWDFKFKKWTDFIFKMSLWNNLSDIFLYSLGTGKSFIDWKKKLTLSNLRFARPKKKM